MHRMVFLLIVTTIAVIVVVVMIIGILTIMIRHCFSMSLSSFIMINAMIIIVINPIYHNYV